MTKKKDEAVDPALEAMVRAGADDDYSDLESDDKDRGDDLADESTSEDVDEGEDKAPEESTEAPETENGEEKEESEEDEGKDKGDGESEEESEESEEADEASEQAEGGKKREKFIPRSRFDEVNNKLKAERERRKALEAKLGEKPADEQPQDPDKDLRDKIDDLTDKYEEALLDGDKETAKTIRKELRQAEEELIDRKASRRAQEARKAVPEDVRLQQTIEDIKTKYPLFDDAHEDYNEELTEEVLTLAESFTRKGQPPAAALRKAVDYVVKVNDLKAADDEAETDAEPEEKPAAKPKQPTAEQRKKKLDLATKQPPKGVARAKEEPTTPQVQEMTEEEFDALPESKKRQLRGDTV